MMSEKEKVLIITQYSMPAFKHNMNAYQRIFHGAEHADVLLLLRRKQTASDEIRARVHVHHAPVENRLLFLFYAILFTGYQRLRGRTIVFTDPSGFSLAGLVAKYLFGCFWVLDLWDRPRRHTGTRQEGMRLPVTDRLVFWTMRHADVFVLSLLPRAVRDIDPPASRCVQFKNAIDLSLSAERPPLRSRDDPTLHAAYGRSEFHEHMGMQVVIRAVERLMQRGCPVHIHTVGKMSDEALARIQSSEARAHFTHHGVLAGPHLVSRLYRTIHVGLVPFLPFWDLSYVFPIKVLEHLSQGNPVIASDLPGLAETIRDGYNGLLVPAGDAEALADALERLQKDVDLWQTLADNALKSSRQYGAGEKNAGIFAAVLQRFRERR
jgi:glycosyltransferase involved in cell wall biosynthesis